jgi:hypothetical protein
VVACADDDDAICDLDTERELICVDESWLGAVDITGMLADGIN